MAVRRLFALVVLLLLPLQLTFAAGAEYCETGKSHSSHFGHHVHASQDVQGDVGDGQDGTKSPGKTCAFCYLGCSQAATSKFEWVAVAGQSHYTREASPIPSGIPASVPDLPPRAALV